MIKVKRESNIELLRIVIMLMIITHHIIVHGFGLKKIGLPTFTIDKFTYYALALNSFVAIAVNVFIFISGYFGIKFKLRAVLSLVLQAVFYSVILYLVFYYLSPTQNNIDEFTKSFFPISGNTWWYITCYVALYFISPFLNKGAESLGRNEFKTMLVGLLFLNCFSGFLFGSISENGYSIFNFIVIYLIGRYIRIHNISIKHPLLFLSLSTFILFCISMILVHTNNLLDIRQLFYYNNPIIITSSIMLFFVFYKLNIKNNKHINLIAGSVLGIYMLHDYIKVRELLAQKVWYIKAVYGNNELLFILVIFALIVSVFTVTALIDIFRKKSFVIIGNKLDSQLHENEKNTRWLTNAKNWYKRIP